MKWEGNEQSDNVEDRRDGGGGGGGGFLGGRSIGIGTIAVALVAGWVFGINPLTVLGLLTGGGAPQVQQQQAPAHAPPAAAPGPGPCPGRYPPPGPPLPALHPISRTDEIASLSPMAPSDGYWPGWRVTHWPRKKESEHNCHAPLRTMTEDARSLKFTRLKSSTVPLLDQRPPR
jgi:hypothetical protein